MPWLHRLACFRYVINVFCSILDLIKIQFTDTVHVELFLKIKYINSYRDDVVFLVLLYQRWIYRIDYSRVNEYGQVNEGMVEDVGTAEGAKKETKKTK